MRTEEEKERRLIDPKVWADVNTAFNAIKPDSLRDHEGAHKFSKVSYYWMLNYGSARKALETMLSGLSSINQSLAAKPTSPPLPD